MTMPHDAHPTNPHHAALRYAALGWRVIPIKPGTKYPGDIEAWQNAATTDTATINAWWTGLYNGWGVGIATGAESGLWVLDIDVADGKTGDETIHDLEDSYGPIPDTVEAITGRGGRHLFFRYPDGVEVRAGAATRLGEGLDVRGIGGQVLAAPTVGPTGGSYTWLIDHEPGVIALADAPGWLLALVEPPAPPPPAKSALPNGSGHVSGDGNSIAATFNAATTWPQLLERDGWTLHHVDRDGEQHWTRPGKDRREGTSATVGYQGNDALKVFTSSVPQLEADRAYSRFGYEAAVRYSGDRSVAASKMRAAMGSTIDPLAWIAQAGATQLDTPADDPTEPATPVPLDIRWVDDLDRHAMPPEPPVLVDGLLRRGEMCVFGAPRAIGKTWLAYNLAIGLARGEGTFLGNLEVRRPANVLYLQGELDQWGSATRWKLLTGIASPLPHVAETFDRVRFRTVKRRAMRGTPGGTVTEEYIDAHIDDRIEQAIIDNHIDVVIVDPWAVYLAGAENSNDEVEAVLGQLREITLRTGVAWVIIHHITGKAERSSWTEPEDLWRGATRLADWASTRVTVLPHYTEAQYKEKGLTRREARRHANVHFLRRSTPTDDFTMRLDQGWWVAWSPEDDPTPLTPPLALARALVDADGELPSVKAVAIALEMSQVTAAKVVDDAVRAGLVTTEPGPHNATVVRLVEDVQHPWLTGRSSSHVLPSSSHFHPSSSHWEDEPENGRTNERTESVSDQGEHTNEDTRPPSVLPKTWEDEKAQVKCDFQRPPSDPSPTERGSLEGPPPSEGSRPDANSAPSNIEPANVVGEQEDGSWLF
jgi:hypothetical protein